MGKKRFTGLEVTLMVLFALMSAVAITIIALYFTDDSSSHLPEEEDAIVPEEEDAFVPQCPVIPQNERVDCFPDAGASKQQCEQRGCCWDPVHEANVPWCFFSTNHGYTVESETRVNDNEIKARLRRMDSPSLFGGDLQELSFHAEMQSANRLRFKISDVSNERFQVPHVHVQNLTGNSSSPIRDILQITSEPFGLVVHRQGSTKALFNTTVGPLVFANQFLQLSAKLPSHNIYGLGEHVHKQYRHDTNWKTWPIFTRDAFPNGGEHNLYGHYPFFLCLEDESGKSFGVFLMNSNAMEVVLQPTPAVTFRTIGGVLDFYILFGETPEQVVHEFQLLVGMPVIPPYWSLGFQLSRWDYGSLAEVKETVERNRAVGLPYDVQYTDIDYMEDKRDFTYDKVNFTDLPSFADYLHEGGQKYILILDPAIAKVEGNETHSYPSYDHGTAKDAWVTVSDGKTALLGEVWPGETVFPDYTKDTCIQWWADEYEAFYKIIKHDALWIDMNEVANFKQGSVDGCANNSLNYPPYTPNILDKLMYSKTLCMDAQQSWGSHYDVHSLYGYSMVLATEKALQRVFDKQRTLMLTRSSFPGVGKYSGHWLGDNAANWNDIKWAIPGMLEFGLFGVPYIGADICGFFDNSTEELCSRWMQVGAFYPFSRNHNAQGYRPQDPAFYGSDSLVVNSSKHYLNIRYTLLPYLYTLFYKAHTAGETVMRPVMHEFYSNSTSWTVDRQFLWGKHLLITPVLDPGVDTVSAYIPDAVWYDYETMEQLQVRGQYYDMHLPADKLGLHIRGGAILPTQKPNVTTTYSRRNPMGLIIALDDDQEAAGELFWDDGDSRDTVENGNYIHYSFSAFPGNLTMQVTHAGYKDPNNVTFDSITILGVPFGPFSVSVRGSNSNTTTVPDANIQYDIVKQVLTLQGLSLTLGETYVVEWETTTETLYQRIDCNPEEGANEAKCTAKGCLWQQVHANGVPWCFYPRDYGYIISDEILHDNKGISVNITQNEKYASFSLPGSPNIANLRVEIRYLSSDMLQFKIWDPATDRYEVPVPLSVPSTPETDESKRLYNVTVTQEPFGIMVQRKTTGGIIWDSSMPGFTFSDMFIQMSTRLSTEYVYGFGETEHPTYKHNFDYHTWGMFAKDQPPGYKKNCYGVHPFYMAIEDNADAHGVLLLNSNAMDVTFQPAPSLTYRTVGGILDFYMFLGPTPENVVQTYTSLIGRPVLPAYWSLGFQLCRYGYTNDTEIKDLYAGMKDAGIPYDVQYADIDYMERQLDFVLDPEFERLPELVDSMREEGMRFIFILDPAISGNETDYYPAFERGKEADVFIKWPKGISDEIVWGKVWPDYPNVTVNDTMDWDYQVKHYRAYAAFPDFFRNTTASWWKQEIKEFYENTTKFDGIWIDMNEPASFVHGTVGGICLVDQNQNLENPPYMPKLDSKEFGLNHKTLCMSSEQILSDGKRVKHYDVHNLYGWSHTKPTYDALLNVTGKRGIVVTRSTYPSSGQWAGHWLGDNSAMWDQLHKSIIGMMEFSLFGISYTGADICGFFNDAEYEMCLRWMHLGAFYPYSRNHNGKGNKRQDPVAWNSTFSNASREVLNIRYTLLPYLYTLMYDAHTKGSTVIRPLLHEFVKDKRTLSIDKQFLWGPGLLITPALDPGVTYVRGYFPDARWYNYHTAEDIGVRGKYHKMDTPLDHINLHVRGGYILPWQKPEANTMSSRKNPLGLIVALSDTGTAQGSLFWDDGEGIDTVGSGKYLLTSFTAEPNKLSNKVDHDDLDHADLLTLGVVKVWGAVNVTTTNVTLTSETGTVHNLTLEHNNQTQELIIDATSASIAVNQLFTITW